MKQLYAFSALTILLFFLTVTTSGQTLTPINGYNNPLKELKEPNNPILKQELCGTNLFHNKKMSNDAQYRVLYENTLKTMREVSSQNRGLAGGVLQVPIVVHVMHQGEAVGNGTNISDEDVKRGIKYLNNYWRKTAGSWGDGKGVDMKIEFVLAVQDESGNCTDGIDRVNMSNVPAYVNHGVNYEETNGLEDYTSDKAVNSLKEYSIWDPTKYYNVWIVDKIDGKNCFTGGDSFIAGYAYYAAAHGMALDGSVVLICSYLNESSSTWAHEMGHAFNLLHTFQGDDSKGDDVVDQCGDDGVFDTPKHKRTLSITPEIYFDCNNSDPNSCDPKFNQIINPETGFARNKGTHEDHINNYMDYSGCASEFTGGQRSVVTTALFDLRSSYLSSLALTPPSLATAFFTSSSSNACVGTEISFQDNSTCIPNSYTNSGFDNITFLWTFNNGVDAPYTTTDQNPTLILNKPGIYDVTLSVTSSKGKSTLTKPKSLNVSPGVVAACFFDSFNKNGNYGLGVTNVSFNTINKATTTYIPASATQDFTCSDNTTLYLGTSYDLKVDYVSIEDGEQFTEVWIDWDNSGTFEIKNSTGVNEMVLADNIAAGTQGSALISVIPPATAKLNTLLRMRVLSEYTRAPLACGSGFAQRADDYGVLVTNTLSITDVSDPKFKMYPNPVKDYLNFVFEDNDVFKGCEIYDITGRKVMFISQTDQSTVEVSRLPIGLYFIRIKTDRGVLTAKFIKE